LFELDPRSRTPEHLSMLFREAWTDLRRQEPYVGLFDDVDAERRWGVGALRTLANYFRLEDPTSFEPLGTEIELTCDLGGIRLHGILDRLDRGPDGRFVVTDYKTGTAPGERFAHSAFFGLKIYALLVRSEFAETPSEIRLLYLGGSTSHRLRVDDRRLEGVVSQLRALWRAIVRALESDEFPARPGRACGWCSYRDICPAYASDRASLVR
jgi:putative RecB family exonuclease